MTVEKLGFPSSWQIVRRLSPSAIRRQISSASSAV
jgi:hypothetical protein